MCVDTYMTECHVGAVSHTGQKRASDPLELELTNGCELSCWN